jgi:hypothetical protein
MTTNPVNDEPTFKIPASSCKMTIAGGSVCLSYCNTLCIGTDELVRLVEALGFKVTKEVTVDEFRKEIAEPQRELDSLQAHHCIHCGTIYIMNNATAREECFCGTELYPVSRKVMLGRPLLLGDDYRAVVDGE